MNKLLYPDWSTFVFIENDIHKKYIEYIVELITTIHFYAAPFSNENRCESMLKRIEPIYDYAHITHVICRDLDSVCTYKEKKSVDRWLEHGTIAHGINDNPVHNIPLMGGMIGFKVKEFKELFPTFENLIQGYDLRNHGSDQNLLMGKVYPLIKDSLYWDKNPPQITDNPLWESDLTCRHIGSAGVVEMELLRFFDRHDPDNKNYQQLEKQFPNIFYWHNG